MPMESSHPDERPAKKPRFFADDSSPEQERKKPSGPAPQPSPQSPLNSTNVHNGKDGVEDAVALDGFDVGMLQAVVGELPSSTLQKLKDVSSSNVERGR